MLPDSLFDFIVGLGSYRPDRGVHVSEVDSYWDEQRPIAYGAAGTYAMPQVIALEDDNTEHTGLCSFRKIVVRDPIGRESTTYPGMREASAEQLAALTPDDIRPREGFDFLISRPLIFQLGMVGQYAERHHPIDLLDYLSLAVGVGVLSASELRALLMEQLFVPGGCEFGVFPTDWIGESLSKLELVGREFLTQHGERVRGYDAYQIRAVGFLSERLGSFYLIQELRRRYPHGLPGEIIGHVCTAIVDGKSYTHGVASNPGDVEEEAEG